MNSEDKKLWRVVLAGPAQRSLERIPARDRARIRAAIDEMEIDPFSGDIKHLKGQGLLRRRIGSWRIFYRLERREGLVWIVAIQRRTSTTY